MWFEAEAFRIIRNSGDSVKYQRFGILGKEFPEARVRLKNEIGGRKKVPSRSPKNIKSPVSCKRYGRFYIFVTLK